MLGLDIDNNTKAWEKLGSNIKIEIGNQGGELAGGLISGSSMSHAWKIMEV